MKHPPKWAGISVTTLYHGFWGCLIFGRRDYFGEDFWILPSNEGRTGFQVWESENRGGERSSKPWVSGDVKLGLPRLRTFSESEMIERFSQRLELGTAHQ